MAHEIKNREERMRRLERDYQADLWRDRRLTGPKGFPAKFSGGTCPVCGDRIEQGQLLRSWNRSKGQYAHSACVESLA